MKKKTQKMLGLEWVPSQSKMDDLGLPMATIYGPPIYGPTQLRRHVRQGAKPWPSGRPPYAAPEALFLCRCTDPSCRGQKRLKKKN